MNVSVTGTEIEQAYQLLDEGNDQAAHELALRSMAAAEQQSDVLLGARAQALLGVIAGYGTRYPEGTQRLFQAIPALEASLYRRELARAYVMLGFSLGMLGDPEHGLEWAGKSLALAEQMGNARDLVRARINRAVLMDMLGEWQQAVDSMSQAVEQARAHGFKGSICAGLLNMGEILLGQARRCREHHDLQACRRHAHQAVLWYRQAVQACREHGFRFMLADACVKQARALVLQKKVAAVDGLLDEAMTLSNGNEELLAEWHLTWAMAAALDGRWHKARSALRTALHHAQACAEPELELQVIYEQVMLERACGRLKQALTLLEQRHQLQQHHFKRRLRMVSRAAEAWVEAEEARQQARDAIHREAELLRSQAELLARAEQLHREAMRDGLTELLNRRGFEQAVATLAESGSRYGVVLIDADHFKRVNDEFGHQAGDQVLKVLGRLLAAQARPMDVLARLGGEEFVLVLPGLDLEAAGQVSEQIRLRVREHDWTALQPGLAISVSLGVSQRHGHEALSQVLHRADLAMYDAKAAGRDCVRLRR